MTSTVATATEIRSSHVDAPQAEIDDRRRRIAATRWPEKETVTDASHGVQWATMRALAAYWTERAYPSFDEGNHFAAWQEPDIFTNELRAAFKTLR